MKLIIAGGRDYRFTELDKSRLDRIVDENNVTEVVSGGAAGADREGEKWAEGWGIPVKKFPADWEAHGKAAGPIRNRQMAEYADALAFFPGGAGTKNMHLTAVAAGLKIYDFRVSAADPLPHEAPQA